MLHCDPEELERSESNWPDAPENVSVPATVCVVDAVKVSVLAEVTVLVKL